MIKKYFSYSKDLFTSFTLILPLLIVYEIIFTLIFSNKNLQIRNSADLLFREIIFFLKDQSQFLYILFLVLLVIVYVLLNKKKYTNYSFNINYNVFMIIEAIIAALILLILLNGINIFYNEYHIIYDNFIMNFYFCLGAGVWEEIFFRFFVFNLLFYIILYFTKHKPAYFISILVSSLLFSLFHYIGNLAYDFTIYSFVIRFVAGIFLCLIYIYRGLGITCLTHYFYDVFLLSLTVI